MDRVGKPEAATQKRVIDFFQTELKYNYIGNLRDNKNTNIDGTKLTKWLTDHGYTEGLAERAVDELIKAATNLQDGLYAGNREVYQLLKYGAQVRETVDENQTTVYFIDWDHVRARHRQVNVTVIVKDGAVAQVIAPAGADEEAVARVVELIVKAAQ